MGKKKDKHREKHDAGKHGGERHDSEHGGMPFPAPLAGLAAMVSHQVTQQLNSPATRAMMATGLRAAADALSRRIETPPVPPVPPATPDPIAGSTSAGDTAAPPRSERQPLPPEVARVVETVAGGIERWAAKLGQPRS